MQMIDKKLDQELVAFICEWDALEKTISDEDIIDINLSERVSGKVYENRDDVLKDIEKFLLLPEIKNHELIHLKMTAHHYFLRALMGEEIPFDEYFKNTMGTEPILFLEEKLDAIRNIVEAQLAAFNLTLHEKITEDLDALEKSDDNEDLFASFSKMHNDFYQKIDKHLNLETEFNINYSYLPVDHQFMAWIAGDGKDYVVQFHPVRIKQNRPSKMKYLAAHELTAHAVQFAAFRKAADAGSMPVYLNYITTHEPIMFSVEGLATTLPDFYPKEFEPSKFDLITENLSRIADIAVNNASLMLLRGGNYKESLDYIMQKSSLSEERANTILSYIQNNKHTGHGYRLIYGIAKEVFLEIAGSHLDKNAFIKSAYKDFLMPQQIIAQTKRPIGEFV